jgi:hypothetical protein
MSIVATGELTDAARLAVIACRSSVGCLPDFMVAIVLTIAHERI